MPITFCHCIEDYLKGDWMKPSDLYGISKYGSDSYRIFCLGEWKEGKYSILTISLHASNVLSQDFLSSSTYRYNAENLSRLVVY